MALFKLFESEVSLYLSGLGTALSLFFQAGLIGFVIGCLLALGKSRYIPGLYWLSWGFTELFRNIPLLIILFLFYYGLQFTGQTAGLLALSVWASAFFGEAIRTGIQGLSQDMVKAAWLLGLSRFEVISNLVLPQALARILPLLANQCINLMKNTSIVYFVGVLDITYAFELLSAKYFIFFTTFVTALATYMTLCLLIIYGFRWLDKRINRTQRAQTNTLFQGPSSLRELPG